MAACWCESFQVYPSIANMLQNLTYAQIDGVFSLSTANPATGAQGLRATTAGTPGGVFRTLYGSSKTTAGFAYRFYLPNLPTDESSQAFVLAAFLDAAKNQQVLFALGTDGGVVAYGGGTFLGSGFHVSGTLLARSNPCTVVRGYNHIEFRVTPGSASAGSCEVRVNGVTVLNFSGDTIHYAEIAQAAIVSPGVSAGVATVDFGDMHAWDTLLGQGPQDFVGNAAVVCRELSADSTPAQWALSSGSVAYTLLEDNSDATYIEADTVGLEHAFLAGNFPADVEGIVYQQVNFRALKINAGDCDITPGFISGGDTDAGTVAVLTTGEAWYTSVQSTDPATSGAPWTVSGAEAAKVEFTRTL